MNGAMGRILREMETGRVRVTDCEGGVCQCGKRPMSRDVSFQMGCCSSKLCVDDTYLGGFSNMAETKPDVVRHSIIRIEMNC